MSTKLLDVFLLAIKSLVISLTIIFLHDSYRLNHDFPIQDFKRCLLNQKALQQFLHENQEYSSNSQIQSKDDFKYAKTVDLFPKLIKAHPFYIGEDIYRTHKKKAWCDYHGEVQSIHHHIKKSKTALNEEKRTRLFVLAILDFLILLGLMHVFRVINHNLQTSTEISLWFILYLLISSYMVNQFLSYLGVICIVGLCVVMGPIFIYHSKSSSA